MAPPAQSQRSPSPSQPSGKGEVSDLKMQLRQLAGSRAPGTDDSKRDLFKKVISYMTIGIDVSSLFSEMVMCSATSDIVLKKMCYLYVGNYAKGNPDIALLTINFLQKDCKDEDPMIRGLALRSLCSLRVANLVEYLVGPLGLGLKDGNSYVRMVATIGVLKLYHISAATCIDADFPAMLKHLMLNDPDTQVVANCLSALQEIWSLEASQSEEALREREALLSKPVIYYFLNRSLSPRRNRLETQRMNALVFVKYNIQLELRQEKRQERGDTYDPIYLSDMESDDEWITEKEGPVLPVDHSWMDIEECFKDDGTVGKKRKRGPRNLNGYGRKKGKKKASQLDDEDEIEVLDGNEVIELEEEEFDEATMADDNDDDDDVEELDLEDD